MYKCSLLIASISVGLTACVSNHYTHPLDLCFQENKSENNQTISVKRDEVLCAEDTKDVQKCPIEFYIDSIKAGSSYVNNSYNYHFKS